MIPKVLSLPCLIAIGCCYSLTVNAANTDAKWNYVGGKGPTHWGMLDSSFELCDTGRAQSPINLDRHKTRVPYDIKISYPETVLHVNHADHGFQLNALANIKDQVVYRGKVYKLVQFHFHSPSETLWHKESFPLEIHFVHENKDKEGLVVAVFVNGGAENASLKLMQTKLAEFEAKGNEEPDFEVNLIDLLPADKRYYSYPGSLTTPPCKEGFQWIVMPKPITASPAQILRIRQEIGGSNARPVQALNGRVLQYAVE